MQSEQKRNFPEEGQRKPDKKSTKKRNMYGITKGSEKCGRNLRQIAAQEGRRGALLEGQRKV